MLAGSPAASDSNIKLLGGDSCRTHRSTNDMAKPGHRSRQGSARGGLRRLAGMTSYGGGYVGMGSNASSALADSAEGINLANDLRTGDTKTLGVTQAIDPIKYTQGSDIAGTIASSLGKHRRQTPLRLKGSASQSLKSVF